MHKKDGFALIRGKFPERADELLAHLPAEQAVFWIAVTPQVREPSEHFVAYLALGSLSLVRGELNVSALLFKNFGDARLPKPHEPEVEAALENVERQLI